jgi:glycosyltransferase involved in cell wall biosynthesis
MKISVVIPTHNPDTQRFAATLQALRRQSLSSGEWELVVIDNASQQNVKTSFDFSGFASVRVVGEPALGLTRARLCGIKNARGPVIVFVDDDNVLAEDYLAEAVEFFDRHARVGAAGGKSLPRFEVDPLPWVRRYDRCLALRDLGDQELVFMPPAQLLQYPDCAPIGAGMAVRADALRSYVTRIEQLDRRSLITDRQGKSLSSGGDNDLVLTILEAGWGVAYSPKLILHHLIPEVRTRHAYLARMNRESSRSWVAVLEAHGIVSWKAIPPWSVPVRIAKAYISARAWRGPVELVDWQGRCGIIEGQARL